MDNLIDHQRKRYELLTNIQKMVASDFSDKDIALALGISFRRIHAAGIAKKLKEEGCSSAISTIRKNVVKFAKEYGFNISKCRKGAKLDIQKKLKKVINNTVTIKKTDLIKFLWTNDNSKVEEIKKYTPNIQYY